jgi:DNA-binding YbaB/EbfC family protein
VFDKIGQLAGLMKNLPRIQEEVGKLQQKLAQLVATADAGAGMVTVTVNGKMEVLRCQLSDEALKMNDREMLEDLIRAATNRALEKVRELTREQAAKMASEFGLPVGMGLPGLE